jgi:hypothetical protein
MLGSGHAGGQAPLPPGVLAATPRVRIEAVGQIESRRLMKILKRLVTITGIS